MRIRGVRVVVAWRVNYFLWWCIVPVPMVVAVVVGLSVVDLWRVVSCRLRIMNLGSSHVRGLLNNVLHVRGLLNYMLNVRWLLNNVMLNIARMLNDLVLGMLNNVVHNVLLRHIVVRFVCSVEVVVLMHLLPLLLLAVERRVVALLVRLKLAHPAGSL